MITVQIGQAERSLEEATPNWITQQVRRRREDGAPVRVRVRIDCPGLSFSLATPDCASVGGGRRATPEERPILDLWQKHGLAGDEFTGGNLVAFLKQLEHQAGIC